MNLIEFGYSLITGDWRLRRELVREERAFRQATAQKRQMLLTNDHRLQLYAGAEPSANRPPPNVLTTPEDYKPAFERIVLIRAARQLEEDGGFFDGILDDFETFVVGESAVFTPNTGNPEANKVIQEFLEWKFNECDYSKRLDLTKLAQLAVRSMLRDGECGFIPIDTGDHIQLRYYSGDCIGNPMIGANVGPNNYNGIRTDPETDAPVWYDLFRRIQKVNCYVPERSVTADNFWHYYDPFRFQQYHGVSAFKNAIRDGFDIDQILEFTKMNIKWRASQLPTVHTETGRPRGAQNGYWQTGFGFGQNAAPRGPGGEPRPMQVNVDGVTTTFLKLDEQVMEYPNDFPNAQLRVAIEEFRRQCCKGVKIPYEFAYRADNGGVVQRFWADKAMRTFAKQKWLLKRVLLNPYKNRVIQKGIDTGELDLDRFGDLNTSLARFKGQWALGRAISVDYGRETDADIKQMEAGLLSPVDYATDNGRNLDEIRQEIRDYTLALFRDAENIAKATGRTFEEVLPYLQKKFPNPVMAPVAKPAEEPEEKETEEEREELARRAAADNMRMHRENVEAIAREVVLRTPAPAPVLPAAAPVVNVTVPAPPPAAVTVNMPPIEMKAPQVRNEVTVQPAAAPSVTVQAPPAPPAAAAPVVNVHVPPAPPPVVNVTVPPVQATLSFERDDDGKLKGGRIE